METSLKTGFAQISLAAPKNLSYPKFQVGSSSPRHPQPVHLCYIFDAGLINWSPPEAINPFFKPY